MSVVDRESPREFRVMLRGDPLRLGEVVDPGMPEWLSARVPADEIRQGSGRLDLAAWIVHAENPLTVRVLANRIWTWHFGQSLVATPSDFGTRGATPSHPELLDHLAGQLLENGWNLKQLHRSILLSSTYRQASLDRPEMLASDPANQLLWRMPRRRLEWEVARDCWLQTSQQLDRRRGGPADAELDVPRRSIYQRVVRVNPPALLQTFDVATPEFSVGRRSETTTVQQSLFLMNHPWLIRLSRALGNTIAQRSDGDTDRQVVLAFESVLHRRPTAEEREASLAFLRGRRMNWLPSANNEKSRPNLWSYGYGFPSADRERTERFTRLPFFAGSAWQGGEKWPDEQLHYLRLTARGGHVGIDDRHAAIRRWTAPVAGRVSIRSELVHGIDGEICGDGVEGLVISSRHGLLHQVAVHDNRVGIDLENIVVEAGDTLDFVTLLRDNHFCDMFEWSPVILWEQGEAPGEGRTSISTFSATEDFPLSAPREAIELQAPLDQLIQTLLISNEFLFVD